MEKIEKIENNSKLVKRPKTGGRKPGSKNQANKDLRTWIGEFLKKNTRQIERDFKLLKPFERIQMIEKLMKYALPTLQAVNLTEDLEKQLEAMDQAQLEELVNKILDAYNLNNQR